MSENSMQFVDCYFRFVALKYRKRILITNVNTCDIYAKKYPTCRFCRVFKKSAVRPIDGPFG